MPVFLYLVNLGASIMPFYESVFILRQDISSTDVDKITEDFTKIVKECGSSVIKNEYWGFRNLAYEIGNNKKGHYVLLGLEADTDTIKELERRMKLNENIIRFSTVAVDSMSKDPSPILKGKNTENEEIVDVTISKDLI